MRKVKVLSVALVCLLLVGCAGLQVQWNKLSPDQKARVILNGLQDELSAAFDSGKVYIQANPKYQEVWKQKIVPAFDVANKTLANGLKLASAGKMTDTEVYSNIQPLITSTLNLLISIGWVKK